jgi:hypothetical protein
MDARHAARHQMEMQIELEEFESGGSRFIRCKNENQRHLLSHLLMGANGFASSELDRVISLASAHGWGTYIHSLPKNLPEK